MTQKVHRRINGVQLREESQLEPMHVAPHPEDEGSHPSPPGGPPALPLLPRGKPCPDFEHLRTC